MTSSKLASLLSLLLLPALAPAATASPAAAARDPHSHARADQVAVKHIHLDLTVDFKSRQLKGTAALTLDRRDKAANELWLDTRDLAIQGAELDEGKKASFEMGKSDPLFGRYLKILLEPDTKIVTIDYLTSPQAGALQWLTPAQTAGKKHPFLFSQSQSIQARTWVPCQDTPSVRFTYSAQLRVPPELLALMSAENPIAKSADGLYQFRMPQPIPSYLLAVAVGDLEFNSLGGRTGVYAEPVTLEKAAWELAETEQMIPVVEKLYGPYRWGRYDLLVLPPSFPYGGMENPRLTFATPTILAGDRSLTSLVAHELAHSWSGNLVTNATWDDSWLNEGFTTYVEYRIMEDMKGKDYAEMLRSLGEHSLEEELADKGKDSPDTRLALELGAERDPDEGSTQIAYEKGSLFLRSIEKQVGRERFDAFLRSYFERNAFKPTTTEDFVAQLESELIQGDAALAAKIKYKEWIYQPNVPDNAAYAQPTLFAKVEESVKAYQAGTVKAAGLPYGQWSTQERLHFLHELPKPLDQAKMAELDQALGLSKTGNSEVLFAWLEHVIASKYQPGYPALRGFLTGMGRMKFLRPLYLAMSKDAQQKKMAEEIYREARPGYHPLAQSLIDDVLPPAAKS
jgi:leukotriene-A4 hydrolase